MERFRSCGKIVLLGVAVVAGPLLGFGALPFALILMIFTVRTVWREAIQRRKGIKKYLHGLAEVVMAFGYIILPPILGSIGIVSLAVITPFTVLFFWLKKGAKGVEDILDNFGEWLALFWGASLIPFILCLSK